jgi:hypothetical protein
MHRSGTSALARIVNFLGASMPRQLVPANESNPRGYWESAPLVALHEQMLAELDSSWDDWRAPSARFRDGEIAARFAGKVRAAIDEEFGAQPLIALKDPRICRTLPFWMSTLEKSGIRSAPLLVVRNPLEVAESLRERDNIPFEKAMLLWLRHNLDAEHETRHLPRNIVTFDALTGSFSRFKQAHASEFSGPARRTTQPATFESSSISNCTIIAPHSPSSKPTPKCRIG